MTVDKSLVLTPEEMETAPYMVECKFTVEHREGIGGDFERNVGGTQEHKRITFEGYATSQLYDALMNAIGEVLS